MVVMSSQIMPSSRMPCKHFVCWVIIFPNPSCLGGAMKMFFRGTPLKCAFLISIKESAHGLPSCLRWAAYSESSAFFLSSGGVLAWKAETLSLATSHATSRHVRLLEIALVAQYSTHAQQGGTPSSISCPRTRWLSKFVSR